jgi:hypothetical protein
MDIFRDLTEDEKVEFRVWARSHPENLDIFESKEGAWHPVVIDEYNRMKGDK